MTTSRTAVRKREKKDVDPKAKDCEICGKAEKTMFEEKTASMLEWVAVNTISLIVLVVPIHWWEYVEHLERGSAFAIKVLVGLSVTIYNTYRLLNERRVYKQWKKDNSSETDK